MRRCEIIHLLWYLTIDYIVSYSLHTAELSQCLEESERLLGELDLMSRRQVTGVTQCAKSLDLLNTDRQAELSERKR